MTPAPAPPTPPEPLTDRTITAAAVGLDVGGGTLKVGAALQDEDGHLHPAHLWPGLSHLAPRRIDHSRHRTARQLDRLCAQTAQQTASALREALPEVDLSWGVAAAAWIRPDDGHSAFSPHLASWRDHPLREQLTAEVTGAAGPLEGSPVVANDADAGAWAEAHLGAGAEQQRSHPGTADPLLFVAIGTGIGGALVREGTVQSGAHGMAGEYGHMSLDPGGPPCACGGSGCWELSVSASALARRAGRRSARTVLDDAWNADPRCRQAVEETGRWLGRGLSVLTAALDPALVVVGGGLAAGGELLLGPACEELDRLLPGRGHRAAPPVVAATLGNDAGWLGAAGLSLRPERRRRGPDPSGPAPAEA